jgi:hypothetical protein
MIAIYRGWHYGLETTKHRHTPCPPPSRKLPCQCCDPLSYHDPSFYPNSPRRQDKKGRLENPSHAKASPSHSPNWRQEEMRLPELEAPAFLPGNCPDPRICGCLPRTRHWLQRGETSCSVAVTVSSADAKLCFRATEKGAFSDFSYILSFLYFLCLVF